MLELSTHWDPVERNPARLGNQAIWFSAHTALAIGTWLALMVLGYALNPEAASQWKILLISTSIPMLVGFLITRAHHDEMGALIWLAGAIWVLMISLWILDLPTGPNACFQCDATEKLTRTFFSSPRPSGLIDDDGPFLVTWPAAALFGYSLGARLAMRRNREPDEDRFSI